jgi:hypothetical protein
MKEASRRYYERNREQISLKAKEKYREAHPTPRPRGRPPKVAATPPSEKALSE